MSIKRFSLTQTCLVRAVSKLILICLLPPISAVNADPLTEVITLSDQVEVVINKYPSNPGVQPLVLWIAPNFGFQQKHNDLSQLLSGGGFEVWMADISEALFLPHNSTAMREINAKYVADLITIAHRKTGKQIVLMSGSYGAIPTLRGAHHWLLSKPGSRYVLGAILFSPNVYQRIPPLGVEPNYLPIAYATNIPVIIVQGSMNSNRWQLEKLVSALRSNGCYVHTELIPDTVDLFYGQESASNVDAYIKNFASNINNQIQLMKNHRYSLKAKNIQSVKATAGSGLDSQIKPFKGNPNPFPIALNDVHGNPFEIKEYRNRVVVVNFWATWCTPCIKEIPSLNKLRNVMRDQPFQLVSINYAESPDRIKAFLQEINVEYPVLVDEQGSEAAKWKVIAFPSTFVIGMDGLIHYGVNAGIEWDTKDVLSIINQLMNKP